MRTLLANLYLALLLVLYLASLLGVLFVSQSAMILGAIAFLLMFLVSVIRHGFKRQPCVLKRLWKVVFPAFAILFVTTILLSLDRGVPKTGDLPIFAKRDKYLFTRGEEASRARFVAVGTCFNLAWHVFAMAFAAEQWAASRRPAKGAKSPAQVT